MHDNDNEALEAINLLANIDRNLAQEMVIEADGHDARIDLVKEAIALAMHVADAVADDMEAVGDGYDVCPITGETHAGNGTEDEGRALALHQHACAAAANKALFALRRAMHAYAAAIERADAIPCEVKADRYVARLARLRS